MEGGDEGRVLLSELQHKDKRRNTTNPKRLVEASAPILHPSLHLQHTFPDKCETHFAKISLLEGMHCSLHVQHFSQVCIHARTQLQHALMQQQTCTMHPCKNPLDYEYMPEREDKLQSATVIGTITTVLLLQFTIIYNYYFYCLLLLL